ncbi:MAG: hypothetical protein KA436_07725 [Oligoflexales bacterium]|nr:hypothetical protein [Oligoflexales bacterium]
MSAQRLVKACFFVQAICFSSLASAQFGVCYPADERGDSCPAFTNSSAMPTDFYPLSEEEGPLKKLPPATYAKPIGPLKPSYLGRAAVALHASLPGAVSDALLVHVPAALGMYYLGFMPAHLTPTAIAAKTAAAVIVGQTARKACKYAEGKEHSVVCGLVGGSVQYGMKRLLGGDISIAAAIAAVIAAARGSVNNGLYEYYGDELDEACADGFSFKCLSLIMTIESLEGGVESLYEGGAYKLATAAERRASRAATIGTGAGVGFLVFSSLSTLYANLHTTVEGTVSAALDATVGPVEARVRM